MKNLPCFSDFIKEFSTSEACLGFLSELKWGGGYNCRRCGHTEFKKGRMWHYKRCKKCQYDESATAHTLFHKLKFPIEKAFMSTYQLSTMKKGMSSCEIARQYGIHQETAWYFRRKVQHAMKAVGSPLLGGCVEIDETAVGGKEQMKKGRSHGKKKMVMVGVEIDYPADDGSPVMKSAAAQILEDYSADSESPFRLCKTND